jgi:nucleoside-diphosphate-sugar epimerase
MDLQTCRSACADREVVFHLASRVGSVGFYSAYPALVLGQNTTMDGNMARAAGEAGVQRYFYPSSVFVYPASRQRDPNGAPLREEEAFPADPPNAYGLAKAVGERMVVYATTEFPTLRGAVLRLMGVYGPYQDIDLERGSIIPVLVRRAIEYPERAPFLIRSTGEETRSYCYIDDVLDAVLLAMEKLEHRRLIGPLNIGSETKVRINEVAEEIVRLSGKPITIERRPEGQSPRWEQSIDCSAARRELDGWMPQVSLREGLSRVFEDVSARLAQMRDGLPRGV